MSAPALTEAIVAGIERRLTWASLHWRTDEVDRDAWKHIAEAASTAAAAWVAEQLQEARGDHPSGFWSQREWEDWSNTLASLIPDGDEGEYSNPEGSQEGIIEDCLRTYVRQLKAVHELLAEWDDAADGSYIASRLSDALHGARSSTGAGVRDGNAQ